MSMSASSSRPVQHLVEFVEHQLISPLLSVMVKAVHDGAKHDDGVLVIYTSVGGNGMVGGA
jgi:hypothetical protein